MEYVTVRLHRGATLSKGAARTLVGYALHRSGRPCWGLMYIEQFFGADGESLLIARPAAAEAAFADYALPALRRLLAKRREA